MSTLSQLTILIRQAIEKLNLIETNSKKIDELPIQEVLNEESKIHVSIDGQSHSLKLRKIIDAVSNNSYNQIISIGELELADNTLIIPAGITWKINNITYTNPNESLFDIIPCQESFTRIDIVVANTDGELILIQGVESAGVAVRPNIPANTVLVTQLNIDDSGAGNPTAPIVGSQYVEKLEFLDQILESTGEVIIELNEKNTAFILTEPVTSLKGFNLNTNFSSNHLYEGKEIRIENQTGNSFTIENNTNSVDLPILFPTDAENITLNNKEIAVFKIQKFQQLSAKLISINRLVSTQDGGITITNGEDFTEETNSLQFNSNDFDLSFDETNLFIDAKPPIVDLGADPLPTENIQTNKIYLKDGVFKWWNGTEWFTAGGGASSQTEIRIYLTAWNWTVSSNTWRLHTLNSDPRGIPNISKGTGASPSDYQNTVGQQICGKTKLVKALLLVERTNATLGTIEIEVLSQKFEDNIQNWQNFVNFQKLVKQTFDLSSYANDRHVFKELTIDAHNDLDFFTNIKIALRKSTTGATDLSNSTIILIFE